MKVQYTIMLVVGAFCCAVDWQFLKSSVQALSNVYVDGQYIAIFLLNNSLSLKESLLTRGPFPFRCAAGHS